MTILYGGVIDWYYLRQRPQQLALELARAHRILYVHPRTLVGTLRRRSALPPGALAAWRDDPTGEGRALAIYEPLLPPRHRGGWLRALHRRLFVAGLRRELGRRGLRPDWLWLGHPSHSFLAESFPGVPILYDCMDNWAAFPDGGGMATAEEALLPRCRLVLASSRPLLDRLAARHPRVHLVPNGVDIGHFRRSLEIRWSEAGGGAGPAADAASNTAADTGARPEGKPGPRSAGGPDPRPVAITVGTLGSWIDLELIGEMARLAPAWDFRIVGPAGEMRRAGRLPRADNLEWAGPAPYAGLPAILARADVAFLPFRLDALTRSVDPVKVYEFLAAGLPVVATPLPELARFRAGLYPATGPCEFVAALEAARRAHSRPESRRALSLTMEDHAWGRRAAAVNRRLEEAGGAPG